MSPRWLKTRVLVVLCALLLFVVGAFSPQQSLLADSHATTLFVNDNASGSGDGFSWLNAYPKLQDALAAATAGDEIWVAAGIYYPDEGVGKTVNSINYAFQLKSGVALYGGFAGTETQLSQRNVATNITILSGDVQQNDTAGASKIVTNVSQIVGANSVNVVTASGVNASTPLDGFVITAGAAIQDNMFCSIGACGGGLYADLSSLTLANLTFSGNKGFFGGGAIFFGLSTSTLTNIIFIGNKAELFGWGLLVQDTAVALLKNVQFLGNEADSVGAGALINNSSTAHFEHATFTDNVSQLQGGGLYVSNSTVTLDNESTFERNTASSHGGGIYANGGTLTMTDTLLTRNASITNGEGGAIYQSGGTLQISHSEITRNNAWGKGGGLAIVNVNATLNNVKFLGNTVTSLATTAYGGGMAVDAGTLAVGNLSFSGNRSDDAGAIYLKDINVTLQQITIAEQEAPDADSEPFAAHGILVDSASVTLQNSIVWAVDQIAIQLINGGGYSGGNTVFEGPDTPLNSFGIMNVSTSPFRSPPDPGDDGYGNDPNTPEDESANDTYGDLRLNAATAVIDAGDNTKMPTDPLDIDADGNVGETLPIDLAGNARIVRFRAATATVDPGAYEYVNLAPTAKIAHPYTIDEGASIELDATGSSDDGGIITYAWDCTNNSSVDVTENSPTQGICTYPNSGDPTLRLAVSDSLNATGSAMTTVTVANIAPAFTQAADQSATAGIALAFSLGSFTDPGAEGTWAISVNWGDSSTPTQFTVNSIGALPSTSHAYAAPDTYDVVVTVNDDGGSDNGSLQVQVAASLPGTPIITPPNNQEAPVGTAQLFSLGSFTDPGSSGPWQVTVVWGDSSAGTVFAMTSSGQLPTQSHTYAEPGDYEVLVSVSDGALIATNTFRVTILPQDEATILLPLTRK